jgi:hypothetical protein
LSNSAYDDSVVKALEDLERAALQALTSPTAGTERLIEVCRSQKTLLEAAGVEPFASSVAAIFNQIKNVDSSLANALAIQLQEKRDRVADRSKHPVPVLVEVLGLTCVAFLLGEILVILRETPTLKK